MINSITGGELTPVQLTGLKLGQHLSYYDSSNPRSVAVVVSEEPGTFGQRCVFLDSYLTTEVSKSDVDGPGGWNLVDQFSTPEEVNELIRKADKARAELKAQTERDQKEREEKLKRGREIFESKKPEWAKAVILAVHVEDKSDPTSDLFHSQTTRTVILGWSKHTRDLFPELRKAARNFEPTAHLADAPKTAEHREKYSMGSGYYLKDSYKHDTGWLVRKSSLNYGRDSLYLAASDPENWQIPEENAQEVKAPAARASIYIEEYSERAVVVRGDTKPLKDELRKLGGKFNFRLQGGPGWIFSKTRAEEIQAFIDGTTPATVEKPKPVVSIGPKLRGLADRMDSEIDAKLHPAIARQNPTRRRLNIAEGMRREGEVLRMAQTLLRKLADMHDAGSVPAELREIKTKKAAVDVCSSLEYRLQLKDTVTDPVQKAVQDLVSGSVSQEEKKALMIRQAENNLVGIKIPGFFPTPEPVINLMLDLADIPDGPVKILEPSAGSGKIADVIRARYPEAKIRVIEPVTILRDILELKGYELIGHDFFEHSEQYDYIIMNPPFEGLRDTDHVRHAYECLNESGTLVSVMSASPFFRSDKKAVAFREWVDDNGGEVYDLPEGSFKQSGTGVNTKLLKITK